MVQLTTDVRQKRRILIDNFSRYAISFGGISVIIAIVTIFFYLAMVVMPLFSSPDSEMIATYQVEKNSDILYMGLDEQSEYAVIANNHAEIIYIDTKSGTEVQRFSFQEFGTLTALAVSNYEDGILALGYENGTALVIRAGFKVAYAATRTVTPHIEYPYGSTPLQVTENSPITTLAMRSSDNRLTMIAATADATVEMVQWQKESSFLDEDEVTITRFHTLIANAITPKQILLDPEQKRLYLIGDTGLMQQYQIQDIAKIQLLAQKRVISEGVHITEARFLIGGISVLLGDSSGKLSVWFPVRDSENRQILQPIRSFDGTGSRITAIAAELRRKGIVTADEAGNVTILHSTANREVLRIAVSDKPIHYVANAPRSDSFVAIDSSDRVHFYHVHNEHPEISWSSLWSKVHYEGYPEPDYIWQSSAANNDFEPKLSLVPLAFGTLKAAFYAMLFAAPLAVFGAIYTAYFMSPKLRQTIKPTIELMEALPTVIIGFLAGLWLAPVIELHLPGIFLVFILVPLTILATSYAWGYVPQKWRNAIPDGWEAALLLPVVFLAIWLSFALSLPMEKMFFSGDMRNWLNQAGINFDQRNSIIIGLAMGFAVIPTIFSIAEDAVFSVPKHLTLGSLALGATPWQTMIRVVILTASPGIFSALMIGLGRAVGETMIVLMATGNTPIMDFNIFEGMRTLAANIAVEMPESEVNSTHYRVLFLAALVLLIFTFLFNTIAETIRHRLRNKYSSL